MTTNITTPMTTTATIATDLALARLLRLASPVLPVGAFSYSQALEWAVESGVVTDADSAQRWIADAFMLTLARCEAPAWLRLLEGWNTNDFAVIQHWNDFFLASREGAELRAETLQMGRAMRALISRSNEFPAVMNEWLGLIDEPAYPTAFAAAISVWKIDARAALTAYLWSWAENQVVAAMKLVPLGQTDGQRLLAALTGMMPAALDEIFAREDDDIGTLAHGFAISSAQHETQYSRLFRS
ncbi:MAG: urease accessory protein UreF [Betaproteobacteria bacterium]